MDDVRGDDVRPSAAISRGGRAALAAPFLATMLALPLEASPIQHSAAQSAPSYNVVSDWPAFLAGGPSLWAEASAPPIDAQVKATMQRDVESANAAALPMVQYLLWRRGLDPTRFDLNHPQYAPWLVKLLPGLPPPTNTPTTQGNPTPSSNPTVPPQTPSVNPEPQILPPGGMVPQPVPEPSALVMAPAFVVAGLWWRRRVRA